MEANNKNRERERERESILHASVAQAITKHEINDSLIAHQQKYQ